MARRLHYRVPEADPAAKRRDDAYEALDALVISLHEHGVLRLLHDVSASLADLTRIGARQIDNPQGYDALANLYVLARLAGHIPAADLERVAKAVGSGFTAMSRPAPTDEPYPPGMTGAYRLLKDEQLWEALGPVLEGVKAFARHLEGMPSDTGPETEQPFDDHDHDQGR